MLVLAQPFPVVWPTTQLVLWTDPYETHALPAGTGAPVTCPEATPLLMVMVAAKVVNPAKVRASVRNCFTYSFASN